MIEYNDGSLGEIKPLSEAFKEAQENPNVAAVHIGSMDRLKQMQKQLTESEDKELSEVVKYYGETFMRIEEKLDRIIKHFGIVKIIGS